MRAADLITGSILALLGVLVIFDSVRLGTGWGTDGPQSGFFPFWLAIIMVGCLLAIMAQETRTGNSRPFVKREELAPVLQVLWPAVVAVMLMHWLGLYVSSALYLAFYMRWVGRNSWLTIVVIALGIPVLIFLVFETWFLVPLPKGPVEAWLGY